MRIAINGFGRIGRTFLRTILQDKNAGKKLEVVAINVGPAKVEFTAHMFKYDTLWEHMRVILLCKITCSLLMEKK